MTKKRKERFLAFLEENSQQDLNNIASQIEENNGEVIHIVNAANTVIFDLEINGKTTEQQGQIIQKKIKGITVGKDITFDLSKGKL